MENYIYLIIEKKRPPLHSSPYEIVGIEFTKEMALKQEKRGYTVFRLEDETQIIGGNIKWKTLL